MAKNPCSRKTSVWVRVQKQPLEQRDLTRSGKWLIFLHCPWVAGVWSRVVADVRAGLLGPAAKVSTHRPSPLAPRGARHVICVYTHDWQDEHDVLRVAKRLATTASLRKMTISYKRDAQTLAGQYSGISGQAVAQYSFRPPYEALSAPRPAVVPRRNQVSRERRIREKPSKEQRLRTAVDNFAKSLSERVERGELSDAAVSKYERAMRVNWNLN